MCSLGQRPNALVWASAAYFMAVHSVPCSGCAMAAQLEPLCSDQQLRFCAPKTCCNLQPALLEFSLDGTPAADTCKRAATCDAPHGRIKAGGKSFLAMRACTHTQHQCKAGNNKCGSSCNYMHGRGACAAHPALVGAYSPCSTHNIGHATI